MKQADHSDSVVDSMAAVVLVFLVVAFAVLWVSGQ